MPLKLYSIGVKCGAYFTGVPRTTVREWVREWVLNSTFRNRYFFA
jgi:hypothetical protein